MFRQLALGAAITCTVSAAQAQEYTLRIQSLFSAESLAGKNVADFFDDLETMSGGRIKVEAFYSSAVVKSAEAFDAAVNGILDGETTQPSYQVGKDTAFQFIGDPMGGYDTPWQLYAWFYEGGGQELAQEVYHRFGMHLVGWWVHGQESLSSSRPLENVESLKNWKFRSPPGMETEIFSKLGSSPIVMDFTEVFTGLETGVIDGADASNLAINKSLGIYDVVDHATFPGFHSMPADHFAMRLELWDSFPDDIKRIIEVGWQKTSFQDTLSHAVEIQKTANELVAAGKTLHAWPEADRAEFRRNSVDAWGDYATTDAAREIVKSHKDFLAQIGLYNADAPAK